MCGINVFEDINPFHGQQWSRQDIESSRLPHIVSSSMSQHTDSLARISLQVTHTPLHLNPVLSYNLGHYVNTLWELTTNQGEYDDTKGSMDSYQYALHRLVFHHITTKPSARLSTRIASLTSLQLTRTQSWFDEERLKHDVPLFSFLLETGEEICLRAQGFGNYIRHFQGWSGFSIYSKTQNNDFWCDAWFDRVVELYWERLLSERYQGVTPDFPSLSLSSLRCLDKLTKEDTVKSVLASLIGKCNEITNE